MPKVTREHLEARKKQILEAAHACFERKGFHQTTMQDICRECSLSPGAIYRYFASKAEIIEAMGRQSLNEALTTIEGALSRLGAMEVLDILTDYFFPPLEGPEGEAHARVNLELSAEALRNEQMRRAFHYQHGAYREALARIVRQGMAEGLFNSEFDPKTVADVLISLYLGLVQRRAVHPDAVNVPEFVRVVRALISGQFWRGPKQAGQLEAGQG